MDQYDGLEEGTQQQYEAEVEKDEEAEPRGAHDGFGLVGSLERRRWYRQRRDDL